MRNAVRLEASFASAARGCVERGRGPAGPTWRRLTDRRERRSDGWFRSYLRVADWLTLQGRLIDSKSEKRCYFSRGSALLATSPQGAVALLERSASVAAVRRVHGEADHGR